MYELKIYFSAEGVENGEKLKELRLELAKRQGRSLLSIYKDFDCLTPVGAVSDEDQLVEVGVNRVTTRLPKLQDGTFSFFGIKTKSAKAPNLRLWTDYVSKHYPCVSVDVIGDAGGTPICKVLLEAHSKRNEAIR